MKIVINTDYGGFGLSYRAMMEYAKRKGFKLYAYVSAKDSKGKFFIDKYIPYRGGKRFCIHYSKNPLTKTGKRAKKGHFCDYDIKRNDPDLIYIVQKMKKKANGEHATLKIVTIPDNINFHIEEHNGIELIAEDHRTWS